MSDKKGRGKKKPKSYYLKCAHKNVKYGNSMDVNMKGFLVTCNGNEKQAVREMYNLLNEYADKLYGPEQISSSKNENDDTDASDSEEEDVEAAMKKEVDAIKKVKPTERRFQNTNTKARNTLFIKTTLDDPCGLAHTILSEIYDTGVQKSRYAIRMLPVASICKCNLDDIEKLGKTMLKQYFETPFGTGLSYTTNFTKRNNTEISRDAVIPKLGQIIRDLNPLHRVNHVTPDFLVLVEVIGNLCCLSVIKDFFKLKKYNLIEVSKIKNAAKVEPTEKENNELVEEAVGETVEKGDVPKDDGDNGDEFKGENEALIESKLNDDVGEPTCDDNIVKVSRKRRREDSEFTLNEKPIETKLNDDVGDSRCGNFDKVLRKRKHEDSVDPFQDDYELNLNEDYKMKSLSREGTVIMESLPEGQFRNVFDRNETVIMESLSKTETVVMQTLDRDVSVMDALSKGESVMEMGTLQKDESTMDVLNTGESVMDAY